MLAILFDFNGTMLFDEKLQEQSWRTFIEEKIHRPVTKEEFQQYIHGRNVEVTLKHFLGQSFSRKETERLEEEKEVIYRSLCLNSPAFQLASGLPHFLDELVKKQIPVTIATASGYKNVQFFFQHLGLGRWFSIDHVAYNDGTLPGKPAPDLYLKAAANLGVSIHDCIIFEDSLSGIEAAKRADALGIIHVASMQPICDPAISGSIKDYTDQQLPTFIRYLYAKHHAKA